MIGHRLLTPLAALLLTPTLALAQPGVTASAHIANGNTASASIVGGGMYRTAPNNFSPGYGYPYGLNYGFVNPDFGYGYGYGYYPFGGGYGGGNVVNVYNGNVTPGYDPRAALLQSIPSLTVPYYPKRQMNTVGQLAPALTQAQPDAAVLTVDVPENAVVYLQGQQMKAKGAVRQYVSPKLDDGKEYTYTLRAVWTVDGKEFSQSMDVPVRAGDTPKVTFLSHNGAGQAFLRDRNSQ